MSGISSITLIARNGDWTGVFTMRPDGHVSGGTKHGPAVRNSNRELGPDAVAQVFALAELVPAAPAGRGGGDRSVSLTINREAGRQQFVWGWDERPSDARVLELLVAVEAVRDSRE